MATKEAKEIAKPKEDPSTFSSPLTVDGLMGQQALIKEAMQRAMVRDVDYGRIPGSEKDSLWQPGAQKICMLFRLAPIFQSKEIFDGNHFTVKSTCTIEHAPSKMTLGSGEGLCTTKEKKYAKRKENGRIVDNANLPDLYNTVLKIGNKRALVAAVLNVTAAGDIFTQDVGEEPLIVEDRDEPKPTEAIVKDAPKEEAGTNGGNGHIEWRGQLSRVEALELPGGRPAWSIVNGDGMEFKTTDPTFADFARSLIREKKDAVVKHHKNGKGSNVIDSLLDAEEAA
jgi:hypothetical protein